MDYYKVLGVSESSSQDDIKKAYRKLSLKHHPDRGGDAEQFKKINEAYSVLGDTEKRRMYKMRNQNPFGQMGGEPDLDPIFRMFFGIYSNYLYQLIFLTLPRYIILVI